MIEENIYTTLGTFAGLTALVSTRIYPRRAPQGATFPHVVFNRISGTRINNLDSENIQNPRFQFDCWAESYSSAKAVAVQVAAAFAASSITAIFMSDRDDGDDDLGLFNVSMDFSIWSA